MAKRSLQRNVSSALAGNIIYALCQFGMLVALARITDPGIVGQYALGLAVTTPVFTFFYFKLASLVATDAHEEFTYSTYFHHRILAAVASMAVITALTALWRPNAGISGTVLLIAAAKMIEAVIDIEYAAMQRQHKLHLIARAQIVRGIGTLGVFVLALVVSEDLHLGLAMVIAYTLPQAILSGRQVRRLGCRVALMPMPSELKRLTTRALPLGVAITLGTVSLNLPRYFLQTAAGITSVGTFSVLAYLLVASGLIINSVGQAVSPHIADCIARGDVLGVDVLVRRLVLFAGILGLISILVSASLGEPLLSAIFGAEYGREWRALTILAIAGTFQYVGVFIGAAITALRQLSQQLYAATSQLIVTAASCALLVPQWHVSGAALSVLVGNLAYLIIYYQTYRHAIRLAQQRHA